MPSASSDASLTSSPSTPAASSNRSSLLLPLAVAVFVLVAALALQPQLAHLLRSPAAPSSSTSTMAASSTTAVAVAAARAPVFFISHGGPPTLFDTKHAAFKQWAKTGRAIQRAHEAFPGGLKGILIVSAHWESDNDAIQINTHSSPADSLIYDFYNFPKHYYEQTFPHQLLGKDGVAEVGRALDSAGVQWQGVQGRGLDHGAWVPGKIMFPESAPSPAPLLQLSLPHQSLTTQLEGSLALGRALAPLRDQGYAIVASGQVVHNLRDLFGRSPASSPKGYGGPFLARTGEWVRATGGDGAELKQVRQWPAYKSAVPEDDHFAPLAVAIGAGTASGAKAAVDLEVDEGPLGWGFYSWSG